MKKILAMFEDLWVAVAFAEAGMYEPAKKYDLPPLCLDAVRMHAA